MEGSSFLGHNMEGSSPSLGVRKGAWTEQEDVLLKNCIQKYGEGKWHQVPSRAGLKRCRKSCRLRWLNYLRPNIKRGEFTDDEVDLIIRLHKLLGNRWTLIAGRLPGRTANDVKNYWNTNLCKKMIFQHCEFKYKSQKKSMEESKIIKPQPRTFSKNSLLWLRENVALAHEKSVQILQDKSSKLSPPPLLMPQENTNTNNNEIGSWWESLLVENKGNNETDTPSISWPEDEPITARLWDDQEVPAGEETTKVGLGGDGNLSGQNYCNCESSCLDIDIWSLLDLEKEMVI